jgi:hypothetical protein
MEIDDDNTIDHKCEKSINELLKIIFLTSKIINSKMIKINEDFNNIIKFKNNIIDIKFDLLAIHNILYQNNINFEKIFDNNKNLDNANNSMNFNKKIIFKIQKLKYKIKFMINHHKKNLEDKNPNNNYKKKKIYLKICDKFCITYRGIYHLKKDSKKFYKIFTKNQIYGSKYESYKKKENKNIFQNYYYNFRKNIMDNQDNLFKSSLYEKEKINIEDNNCLLNNMDEIKYLEKKDNLDKSRLYSIINANKSNSSKKEIEKEVKKKDRNEFIPNSYDKFIEYILKKI